MEKEGLVALVSYLSGALLLLPVGRMRLPKLYPYLPVLLGACCFYTFIPAVFREFSSQSGWLGSVESVDGTIIYHIPPKILRRRHHAHSFSTANRKDLS